MDDQGQWFRFHHLFQSLLQNLLREQLTPDEIAGVRLRASVWCAEHGLLDEAIEYALTSGDPAAAVQMVVRHRYALMDAGQWRRLERWLKRLPADVVAQTPLLLSAQGYLAMQRAAPWEALAIYQQAAPLLTTRSPESEDDQAAMAELAVLKSLQDFQQGQLRPGSRQHAQEPGTASSPSPVYPGGGHNPYWDRLAAAPASRNSAPVLSGKR